MLYRYETHVHTAECDKAASIGGAEIVRMYKVAGYDGLIITDHYFHVFYDWFADELAELDHRQIIARWLKGYYVAREEGEKLGFTVLPGAEVRFDGPVINDYLIYGLDEDFFYDAPLLNRLQSLQELKAVLPESACIVQAHPFRDHMTVQDPSLLFGIEVYNGKTDPFRNELARQFAEYYGKPMTSGSDYHGPHSLAKGGITTDTKIQTPSDLVQILRSGSYGLIQDQSIG